MKPADPHRAPPPFERIAHPDTLNASWRRVKRNGGGPGGDAQTIADFARALDERLAGLARDLASGHYRPGQLQRYRIPKPNGMFRKLAVPCVRDRIVQAAAAHVLDAISDPRMAPSSFAYRRGLSVEHAAGLVTVYRLRGFVHIVDGDIAEFFDNIPHAAVTETGGG